MFLGKEKPARYVLAQPAKMEEVFVEASVCLLIRRVGEFADERSPWALSGGVEGELRRGTRRESRWECGMELRWQSRRESR